MHRLNLNLTHLRALRAIRHGDGVHEVCARQRLNPLALGALLERLRGVPDEVLANLEHQIETNDRLRRVVNRLLAEQAGPGTPGGVAGDWPPRPRRAPAAIEALR